MLVIILSKIDRCHTIHLATFSTPSAKRKMLQETYNCISLYMHVFVFWTTLATKEILINEGLGMELSCAASVAMLAQPIIAKAI